ncbi:cleavage stimulation factor subunit 3 [Striga asiatica]|uniref:Cleavage stimulation factor subunit 3 n=1 Tax=Striga asiatica TaxID=4170 RepID=A0A5A7QLR0_STRAF|nr:cleavage stimulation factor subunit 3 [Striga asiatica]
MIYIIEVKNRRVNNPNSGDGDSAGGQSKSSGPEVSKNALQGDLGAGSSSGPNLAAVSGGQSSQTPIAQIIPDPIVQNPRPLEKDSQGQEASPVTTSPQSDTTIPIIFTPSEYAAPKLSDTSVIPVSPSPLANSVVSKQRKKLAIRKPKKGIAILNEQMLIDNPVSSLGTLKAFISLTIQTLMYPACKEFGKPSLKT